MTTDLLINNTMQNNDKKKSLNIEIKNLDGANSHFSVIPASILYTQVHW